VSKLLKTIEENNFNETIYLTDSISEVDKKILNGNELYPQISYNCQFDSLYAKI